MDELRCQCCDRLIRSTVELLAPCEECGGLLLPAEPEPEMPAEEWWPEPVCCMRCGEPVRGAEEYCDGCAVAMALRAAYLGV